MHKTPQNLGYEWVGWENSKMCGCVGVIFCMNGFGFAGSTVCADVGGGLKCVWAVETVVCFCVRFMWVLEE